MLPVDFTVRGEGSRDAERERRTAQVRAWSMAPLYTALLDESRPERSRRAAADVDESAKPTARDEAGKRETILQMMQRLARWVERRLRGARPHREASQATGGR